MKELVYKGKPTDGQLVQYDAETRKWYPVDPADVIDAPSGASVPLLGAFKTSGLLATIPGNEDGAAINWTDVVGDFPDPSWLDGSGHIALPLGVWLLTGNAHCDDDASAQTYTLIQVGGSSRYPSAPGIGSANPRAIQAQSTQAFVVTADNAPLVVGVYLQHDDPSARDHVVNVSIIQIA